VPILGKSYFTLKADIQTAQAVTPGQGQAVTIAGAKIGEIASVDLNNGVGVITMHLTPEYARNRIYHDATLLLRPKTRAAGSDGRGQPGHALQRSAVQRRDAAAVADRPEHRLRRIPSRGWTPNRVPTCRSCWPARAKGLKGNGKALSAALKRFDPTARDLQEIGALLDARHADVAEGIHNFRLLLEALGGKDRQLSELVQSGNTVFKTFAKEEQSVQSTLRLLPGALGKARQGLGKLATAARVLGPTLKELQPFAKALGPAEEASQVMFHQGHPDRQDADPAVRAPDPARHQRAAARHQGTERVVPGAGKQLLGAERTLQRVRLQPRIHAGRVPVLPRLGQPRLQQRRQHRRRARSARQRSAVLQLQRRADPERGPGKSTRRSGCCSAYSTRRPARRVPGVGATGVKAASAKGRSASATGLLGGLSGGVFGQSHVSRGRPSHAGAPATGRGG